MSHSPARRRPSRLTLAVAAVLLGGSLSGSLAGCTAAPSSSSPSTASPTAPSPSVTSPPVTSPAATSRASSTSPIESGSPTSPGSAEPSQLSDLAKLPDLSPLLVPEPDPEVLGPLLDDALSVQSGTMSAAVRDGLTGELLYDHGADQPVVPASAVKVLTAVAALEVLGPDHRYTTSAVSMPAGEDRTAVVLDAGGDVLLGTGENAEDANGRAGLDTLAYSTVKALQKNGTTGDVVVRLDDSGYAGPGASPAWSSDIVSSGNASTVQPLATYGGRAYPSRDTNRLHDPAEYAAEVFRERLKAHAENLGVEITVGGDVARTTLKGRGTTVAEVNSATVAEQMRYMLRTSDNQLAEATGRNLALASGSPGSFDGATESIEKTLTGFGMDTDGLDLRDASGLSGKNHVSAAQLTSALQIATTDPRLETAVTGLPVAGEQGTLENRMVGTDAEGEVQAKTGTLSSVASLTGTVDTVDGRTLLFSFVANDQPGVLTDARFAVDRAAAVLAGCGCRAD
ncbi:D-alanyl-D-alanine carboxypeptidase/D-alanyl-D-alanine-endopeptidase [Citricoccus sp. GCM10030269]|uniref:D-alanyl-D-alanine carboxypeptidase/D-alanyl-D-alanine endopeptidase n=1 Tax=Citricoccus sp. GCM10030269 TaxID=3273388 RepID=UPI003619DC63